MNRKMISVVVLTIGCIPGVLATSAWGTTISINSITAASMSNNDLTAAGTLDWALPNRSEKSGGSVIVTMDGLNGNLEATRNDDPWGSYPSFSYTDGAVGSGNGPIGTVTAELEYLTGHIGSGASYSAVLNLPAGSGTITAWGCNDSSHKGWVPGTITATFGDNTSVTSDDNVMKSLSDGTPLKAILGYSTATAQTLTITIANSTQDDNSAVAGFNAIAVSTPEPGSVVLLTTGLVALLAYACAGGSRSILDGGRWMVDATTRRSTVLRFIIPL